MDANGEPLHSTGELETALEFEILVSDLSSRFVNLTPDKVDDAVDDALLRVCRFLDFDLAVLWQWSTTDHDVLAPSHSYSAGEGSRPLAPLRQEHYPWVLSQVKARQKVVLARLDEVPAKASVDMESACRSGIKSNLTIPLTAGDAALGALAFNTIRAPRDWPDALVRRLELVAQVFANALARRSHELELHESEARLALATDAAEAGVWTLDFGTGVFWATQRARTLFGWSADEVITMDCFRARVHPDDWGAVRDAIESSAALGRPVQIVYRIILPDGGDERWIDSRGQAGLTSAGKPDRMTGVSIDITERQRALEALRSSEARLRAGAELAGLGFYQMDFARELAYLDDRFRDLLGVPPECEHTLPALGFWTEHLHPDDRARVMDLRAELHDGRRDRISVEYRFLHPEHGERWLHHMACIGTRDDAGGALTTFGVVRDTTERKQIEGELHDLGRRLIVAHEAERALLARELHDDVSQRLAVLTIDVGRAERAEQDEAQAAAMRTIRAKIVGLSDDVHSLAYQLHPSVLRELGLAEALRAECGRQGRRSRLAISLDLEPSPACTGGDATLCLFRVAQEALNNALRHADASAVNVSLRQIDDGLLLAVSDDGVGFDPGGADHRRHLGLASMRERVRLVEGTLDVESAPGQGTTIVAWVPGEEAPT